MRSEFFAFVSRMKYINRWGLMRNTAQENLKEHSQSVAMLAHALGVINNLYFGGDANPDRLASLALYHDAEETITGDMPTTVKYFSQSLRDAFAEVETEAKETLLSMLPEEMAGVYRGLLYCTDPQEKRLVKAADKICAYIKCIEEKKAGNTEFDRAAESTLESINALDIPEAEEFMKEFLDGYRLTLDEIKE